MSKKKKIINIILTFNFILILDRFFVYFYHWENIKKMKKKYILRLHFKKQFKYNKQLI